MRWIYLLALLFAPSLLFAELSAPSEVEPFEPIVVSCDASILADSETQITWKCDTAKFKTIDGKTIYVWAPPGKHVVEATVATQKFQEILVLVPDPDAPADLTKAKSQKVKIALAFSINRYDATILVKGTVPPAPSPVPTPNPQPAPAPLPVDLPSAETQNLLAGLKSVMAAGDAGKAALTREAFTDYLVTMKTGTVPKTNVQFIAATHAFINAVAAKKGLGGAFPGFTAELDKAFAAKFGNAESALDPAKAQDFVAGVVWACSR